MLLVDPLTCLAVALYFEARGESPLHQYMVADTIINRVESKRFPDTICGVVKQKHQFSFFWDGIPEVINDSTAWNNSILMAVHRLEVKAQVTKACHYAVSSISNHWTKAFKGSTHGTHTFYTGGC